MQQLKNYINGELIAPLGAKYIDNFNPATGKVYSLIPDSNEKDVQLAWDAANEAFPAWSVTPKEQRSKILLQIADLIDLNMEMLAQAESRDNGKPIQLARMVD